MNRPGWGTFAEGDEVIWGDDAARENSIIKALLKHQMRGTVLGLGRGGLVIRTVYQGIEARVTVKLEDLRHANELVRFARES